MVQYKRMILDLTDAQAAFQREIAAFARDAVAPPAAAIDEQGTFPRDTVKRLAAACTARATSPRDIVSLRGAPGLLGVTIPRGWGGAGRDSVTYALALEAV